MTNKYEHLVSVPALAEILILSKHTIYQLHSKNMTPPSTRRGRAIMFNSIQVEDWINSFWDRPTNYRFDILWDEFILPTDLARALSTTPNHIYVMRRRGKIIPCIKIGHNIRFVKRMATDLLDVDLEAPQWP